MLPKLTALETIRVCWKDYILPASIGIGTLACIFGANALSRRQQAALASAYAALASAFEGYRQKVDDICGSGTDAMIEKTIEREKKDEEDDRPPWDEGQTFYLGCCEKPAFFERTMEEVLRAEYNLNHIFVTRGFVTLNELFDFLGLESTKEGELSGWGCCVGEPNCGYKWIEFDHSYYIADSGMLVCSINPLIEPHPLELPF